MNYKVKLENKGAILRTKEYELRELLVCIKERLIVKDFQAYMDSTPIDISIGVGNNEIHYNHIEGITINKEILNIFSSLNQKILRVEVVLDNPLFIDELGIKYNGEMLFPTVSFCVPEIIKNYSMDELIEITDIIDKRINKTKKAINYAKVHKELSFYKHHYCEYNQGFKGEVEFINISSAIDYYNR